MVNWLTQLFGQNQPESPSETKTPTSNGSSYGSGSKDESTNSGKRKIRAYATQSGSVYHVDHDNKLVRRVEGKHPPTNYQGHDSMWRPFYAVVRTQDNALGFVWQVNDSATVTVEGAQMHFRTTITSPVIAELDFIEGEVMG